MGIVAAPRCYRIRLQAVKKGEAKERPGVVVHTSGISEPQNQVFPQPQLVLSKYVLYFSLSNCNLRTTEEVL